jgi:hypothetical protein
LKEDSVVIEDEEGADESEKDNVPQVISGANINY